MMFIDFHEFTSNPEAVVRRVLKFVGVPDRELEPRFYQFRPLPVGMQASAASCCGGGAVGTGWERRPAAGARATPAGPALTPAPARLRVQGERRGRRMHPSVKRKLQQYYAQANLRLYSLLGTDFSWADPEAHAHQPGSSSESTDGGLGGKQLGSISLAATAVATADA